MATIAAQVPVEQPQADADPAECARTDTILDLLGDTAKDAVVVDSTYEISESGVTQAFKRLKSRRARQGGL